MTFDLELRKALKSWGALDREARDAAAKAWLKAMFPRPKKGKKGKRVKFDCATEKGFAYTFMDKPEGLFQFVTAIQARKGEHGEQRGKAKGG